jgi:hypothetical protein
VWSDEASLNRVDPPADEDEGVDEDEDVAELFVASMVAVAMDNRERTRSSGYVVPATDDVLKKNARPCNKSDKIVRTDRSNASQSTAG